jgi:hypothetical protein
VTDTAKRIPLSATVLAVLLSSVVGTPASGEMVAENVLDFARMSSEQREALMRGEILVVTTGDEATADVTPSNLYSGLVMWVPQPLVQAVRALTTPPRQRDGMEQIFEIPESGAVPEIPLDAEHAEEIERILSFSDGRKVNLGAAELASLKSLAISPPLAPEELSRFSGAYGRLLEQRFASYRRDGLSGIAPYTRGDGKAQAVGDELRLATERAVASFASFFPDFCAELRRYPQTGRIPHRYLLVHDTWDDRPQYVLVHRMADVDPTRALLLHREFFVSQGYDALQLLFLMVPHLGGTLVALSTDVFTDRVAGFGSGLLHRVGRKHVRKAARMRLEKVRMAIEDIGEIPEVFSTARNLR